MEIAAHKDSATGKIFETPGALADFQVEQEKAAKTQARIEEIGGRLTALRMVVVNSMKTPDDLCALVRDTYQTILDLLYELAELRSVKRTKAQQRTNINVVKVEACHSRWEMDSRGGAGPAATLECSLRVTLSGEPFRKLFCPEMPGLDFETVMVGMRTSGGGSFTDDADGSYTMRYTARFPLKNLPLMYPRVVALVGVSEAKTSYDRSLQLAQLQAFNEDQDVMAVKQELDAAEGAVEEALAARKAVRDRLDQKGEEIAAAVAQKMPFEQQAELDAALDGFRGEQVQWDALRFYL